MKEIKQTEYNEFIKYINDYTQLDYTEEEPLEVDINEELCYNRYMLGIDLNEESNYD
jgi:hypothetical protein